MGERWTVEKYKMQRKGPLPVAIPAIPPGKKEEVAVAEGGVRRSNGERQVCRAEQMGGTWSGRGMWGWKGGMTGRKREEGGLDMASKRM